MSLLLVDCIFWGTDIYKQNYQIRLKPTQILIAKEKEWPNNSHWLKNEEFTGKKTAGFSVSRVYSAETCTWFYYQQVHSQGWSNFHPLLLIVQLLPLNGIFWKMKYQWWKPFCLKTETWLQDLLQVGGRACKMTVGAGTAFREKPRQNKSECGQSCPAQGAVDLLDGCVVWAGLMRSVDSGGVFGCHCELTTLWPLCCSPLCCHGI